MPRLTICLLLAVSLPAPLAGQNLLVNPGFETGDLSGWTVPLSTTFDGAAGTPPGSARWEETLPAIGMLPEIRMLRQCVDGVVAGETYQFGGRLLLTEAPAGGTSNVFLIWRSDPGCAGSSLIVAASPVSTTGSWILSSHSAVAPLSAESVELAVFSGFAAVGPGPIFESDFMGVPGDYEVHADSLFLIAGTAVPAMAPWFTAALGAALAATAALALRRRRRTAS